MTFTSRTALRATVIAIALTEALALAAFIALMLQQSDPIGRSIGQGMALLTLAPLGLLVLPGLYLGFTGRWLPAALALVVLAVPVAAGLWLMA
jgi:hypothetical protein